MQHVRLTTGSVVEPADVIRAHTNLCCLHLQIKINHILRALFLAPNWRSSKFLGVEECLSFLEREEMRASCHYMLRIRREIGTLESKRGQPEWLVLTPSPRILYPVCPCTTGWKWKPILKSRPALQAISIVSISHH
jgi:hypothetical protein